jgi:hypothetical protein
VDSFDGKQRCLDDKPQLPHCDVMRLEMCLVMFGGEKTKGDSKIGSLGKYGRFDNNELVNIGIGSANANSITKIHYKRPRNIET